MVKHFIIGLSILSLVGCSAVQKTIKHGKLETQTKMSETIFLDPVSESEQTVYIKFRIQPVK